MSIPGDKPRPRSLQELDARLKTFRAETRPNDKTPQDGAPTAGLGVAFVIAAHMVSGLAFGAWIGYLLDRWFGTAPFMMVIFFLLGAAAGGLNVYRTVTGIGMAAGYRPAATTDETPRPLRRPSPPRNDTNETDRG